MRQFLSKSPEIILNKILEYVVKDMFKNYVSISSLILYFPTPPLQSVSIYKSPTHSKF